MGTRGVGVKRNGVGGKMKPEPSPEIQCVSVRSFNDGSVFTVCITSCMFAETRIEELCS